MIGGASSLRRVVAPIDNAAGWMDVASALVLSVVLFVTITAIHRITNR